MNTFLSKKFILAALVITYIFNAPGSIDASKSPSSKAYKKRRKRKQHNYRSHPSATALTDKCLENGQKAFRNLKAHGAPSSLLWKLGFILAILTSVSSASKLCPDIDKVNSTNVFDEKHLTELNAQFMGFNNYVGKLP